MFNDGLFSARTAANTFIDAIRQTFSADHDLGYELFITAKNDCIGTNNEFKLLDGFGVFLICQSFKEGGGYANGFKGPQGRW